jgi:hypothetical protein
VLQERLNCHKQKGPVRGHLRNIGNDRITIKSSLDKERDVMAKKGKKITVKESGAWRNGTDGNDTITVTAKYEEIKTNGVNRGFAILDQTGCKSRRIDFVDSLFKISRLFYLK